MALAKRTRQALSNSLFGKTSNFGALASAPGIWIGLSSSTPATDGTGVTEPSGNGYARVATAASDWNVATLADPAVLTNLSIITFAAAITADWVSGSNLTYFVLFDALAAGNVVGYALLAVAKPVKVGDVAQFAAGTLELDFT